MVSGILIALTALFRIALHVNPTTVALTFLLCVLLVSANWGLRYAVGMAIAATALFNYNFLPPIGTFTIADPQNWVALAAFLITAIVASQLSERARRAAESANQRRHELEKLYSFSQTLLVADNVVELLNALPRHVVQSFGLKASALLVDGRSDVYRSSPQVGELDMDRLRAAAARGGPEIEPERGVSFVPLRLGSRSVGTLGISGGLLSRATLEALGSLTALAIERAGAVESLTKVEAAKENEKLRSALLDSVTHEFRTPLTAIKASVTSLLTDANLSAPQRQELLTVVDEESDRLNRLVGQAAEMARLDAGQVELHREPRPIREAIDGALADCRQMLAGHPVEVTAPEELPLVRIDLARIQEVLAQLLENAAKYSPEQTPIRVTAEKQKTTMIVAVADRGPGIEDFEQALIFDKFYRGRDQRSRIQGTGMGLAIARAIVEAHGGTISVTSQLGSGSVFYFTLPL
jgi:two-component system sensor histidine kinase KdpD